MKYISVIIPVYNVAPYIRKTLDSILTAVNPLKLRIGIEVICVDDGSKDGSGAILDEYSNICSMSETFDLRVIHQKNSGVSAARNAALDIATGEWVLFLDGDDRYDSGFLMRLVSAIYSNPDVDAFAFGFAMIHPDGTLLDNQPPKPVGAIIKGDDILAECPKGNWRYTHSSCDKMYRRSVLEMHHLRFDPEMKLGEDTLYANEFLSVCGKVKVLDGEVGYQCVVREGSALRTIRPATLANDLQRFHQTLYWWEGHKSLGLFRTLLFWAKALPSLGKCHGVRRECISILLGSKIFNEEVIPFLIRHGSFLARLFAGCYAISPAIGRRMLLREL